MPGTVTLDHNDAFSTGTAYGDRCAGAAGTDGNIAADPLFSGPGDLALSANSPAVDAGDNGAVGVGSLDFNGAPRIQNAKGLPAAVIDMGAYEHAGVPAALPAPDFSLTADAGAIDLTVNPTATVTLNLAPNSSFASSVALACAGLPANVQCAFQPTSVSLGNGTPQTVQLVLTATKMQASARPTGPRMLWGWLLFPWLPCTGKRRGWVAALTMLSGCLGLSGCLHVTPRTITTSAVTVSVTAQSGQQHSVSLNVKEPI